MNYFEFKEPYYALIKAKSNDEAIKTYEKNISIIENDYLYMPENEKSFEEFRQIAHKIKSAHMRRITEKKAFALFYKAIDKPVDEAEEIMEKMESGSLLLVDGWLL